jgi:hypothetical protein
MRFLIAALSLLLSATVPLCAAERDFAIGVSFGSPMGLSVLHNIGRKEAVQMAFEANVYNPWVLQADYLWKADWPTEFNEDYGDLYIYFGPGMRYEYGSREQTLFGPYRESEGGRFAFRFPGGVQYYVPNLPFDVFGEAAPMLGIYKATTVDLTVALGLRFNL